MDGNTKSYEYPEQEFLLRLEVPNIQELKALLDREKAYLDSTKTAPFESLSLRQQKWRPKIFEWFYKIIDHFSFDRDIVATAMDLLDRYQIFLATEIDGETYQRAAMASLYISIKINCGALSHHSRDSEPRRIFSLNEYASLSRGQFTAEDLTKMELNILTTLNWKLHPVIPTQFLVNFLGLFSPACAPHQFDNTVKNSNMKFVLTVLYEVARYLIEVSITSSDISFYLSYGSKPRNKNITPSSVCFSALLISMDLVSEEYLPYESREHFLSKASSMLTIEAQDIKHLKKIILESFIPEIVLRGSLSHDDTHAEIQKLHPVEILRNAGILCIESERALVNSLVKENKSLKRKLPSSPTSPLEQGCIECL
jgi:hypothetical protein